MNILQIAVVQNCLVRKNFCIILVKREIIVFFVCPIFLAIQFHTVLTAEETCETLKCLDKYNRTIALGVYKFATRISQMVKNVDKFCEKLGVDLSFEVIVN